MLPYEMYQETSDGMGSANVVCHPAVRLMSQLICRESIMGRFMGWVTHYELTHGMFHGITHGLSHEKCCVLCDDPWDDQWASMLLMDRPIGRPSISRGTSHRPSNGISYETGDVSSHGSFHGPSGGASLV